MSKKAKGGIIINEFTGKFSTEELSGLIPKVDKIYANKVPVIAEDGGIYSSGVPREKLEKVLLPLVTSVGGQVGDITSLTTFDVGLAKRVLSKIPDTVPSGTQLVFNEKLTMPPVASSADGLFKYQFLNAQFRLAEPDSSFPRDSYEGFYYNSQDTCVMSLIEITSTGCVGGYCYEFDTQRWFSPQFRKIVLLEDYLFQSDAHKLWYVVNSNLLQVLGVGVIPAGTVITFNETISHIPDARTINISFTIVDDAGAGLIWLFDSIKDTSVQLEYYRQFPSSGMLGTGAVSSVAYHWDTNSWTSARRTIQLQKDYSIESADILRWFLENSDLATDCFIEEAEYNYVKSINGQTGSVAFDFVDLTSTQRIYGHKYFLEELTAKGFIKSDSSDDYVLLGGGGHLEVSSLVSSNHLYVHNLHYMCSGRVESYRNVVPAHKALFKAVILSPVPTKITDLKSLYEVAGFYRYHPIIFIEGYYSNYVESDTNRDYGDNPGKYALYINSSVSSYLVYLSGEAVSGSSSSSYDSYGYRSKLITLVDECYQSSYDFYFSSDLHDKYGNTYKSTCFSDEVTQLF